MYDSVQKPHYRMGCLMIDICECNAALHFPAVRILMIYNARFFRGIGNINLPKQKAYMVSFCALRVLCYHHMTLCVCKCVCYSNDDGCVMYWRKMRRQQVTRTTNDQGIE